MLNVSTKSWELGISEERWEEKFGFRLEILSCAVWDSSKTKNAISFLSICLMKWNSLKLRVTFQRTWILKVIQQEILNLLSKLMEICKISVNQILILIQTLILKTIQKMKKFNIKRKSKRRKQRLTSMIFDHIFILIVNIFIGKSLFIDLFDSVEYFLRFLVLIRHDGEGLLYSFLDHLNDHGNGAISFLLFVNIDSRVIESDCRSKLSDKL